MELAKDRLDADRWEVEDVSASKSFDYIARRGGIELHVEVKGLAGSPPQVLLTINEKRHAQQWRHLAIAIVTGIRVDRAGDAVSASGGDLRYIEPWRIDDGDLEPVQFRWSPRQAGALEV
jgi:hypothetical protein